MPGRNRLATTNDNQRPQRFDAHQFGLSMFTERMSIHVAHTERGEQVKLRFIERLRVEVDAQGREQVEADPPSVTMLNGAELIKLDEGKYQVVETGEVLSLVTPETP